MANTTFFKRAEKENNDITWGEIFSESFKPHSKHDLYKSLRAGLSDEKISEAEMMRRWQKPWVWTRVAMWLLILIGVIYAADWAMNVYATGKIEFEFIRDVKIFAPLILVPFTILVFLWELNIPRNISLFHIIAFFLIGGFGSLSCTMILSKYITNLSAPFTEEPAKLIISVILMYIFSRNKKLYGLNGLIIGAAVGAGFTAFEDIIYVFERDTSAWTRMSTAIGGHHVWAAAYAGAIALNSKNGKLGLDSFANMDFIIAFATAFITHYWGNNAHNHILSVVVLPLAEWIVLLYIAKKCITQIALLGKKSGGVIGGVRKADIIAAQNIGQIRVVCTSGSLKGTEWRSNRGGSLKIGRSHDNNFKFPSDEKGVSRYHCVIYRTDHGWALKDNNSSYGTYLNGNFKIDPGTEKIVHNNDTFYVGGKKNSFKVYSDD